MKKINWEKIGGDIFAIFLALGFLFTMLTYGFWN